MKATPILKVSKLLFVSTSYYVERFQAKINIFHKFNNATHTHTSTTGHTVTSHDDPDLIRV